MKELFRLANELSKENPDRKEEIDKLIEDCFKNIENGCAEGYEVEKCYDLIKETKNSKKVIIKKNRFPKNFKLF